MYISILFFLNQRRAVLGHGAIVRMAALSPLRGSDSRGRCYFANVTSAVQPLAAWVREIRMHEQMHALSLSNRSQPGATASRRNLSPGWFGLRAAGLGQ